MSDYQSKINQETLDAYVSGSRKIAVSPSSYFGKGWQIFSKNMGGNFLNGVVLVFLNIVGPFMQSGYFMGLYDERKGGKPMELGTLFKGFDIAGKVVWHYLVSFGATFAAMFIAMPIMFIFMFAAEDSPGLALFGMGAFYFIFFFLLMMIMSFLLFSIFIMTFSKLEGMDAIKAGFSISKKNFGKAFSFTFIMFVLQIIGTMMCYIGAFVAMPVSVIALYLMCNDIFNVENPNETDNILEHIVD